MFCSRGWKTVLAFCTLVCISLLQKSLTSDIRGSSKSTSLRGETISSASCVRGKCTGNIHVPPASRKRDKMHTQKKLKTSAAASTYNTFCEYVGSQSAISLWTQYADRILQESRLSVDLDFSQRNMMLEMLDMISPRLPDSLQATTRDWATVKRILEQGWDRYQYLQQIKTFDQSSYTADEPRIIQVLVVGGSVTQGNNCFAIKGGHGRHCAWATRLESLVNGLAGGLLIKVHNRALGGVNTKIGQAIWEYGTSPDDDFYPDIVINGHSTNDAGLTTRKGGRDAISEMAQSFVRSVMSEKSCSKRPLLIWLDDYLGNTVNKIKEITILSQEIQVLASYYGFSFVSFANVVRDWVYGDTHGTLFSPQWYSEDGNFVGEVHPGQGMHLATSWIMAYHMLNLATRHCSIEAWGKQALVRQDESRKTSGHTTIEENAYYQPSPTGLPPMLTNNLRLEEVTKAWQADAEDRESSLGPCSQGNASQCVFSWINGLASNETSSSIQNVFAPFLKRQGKWSIGKVSNRHKFGWVPAEQGSELLLEFRNLTQPVGKVTLFPMKSYGEKWSNSNAKIRFLSKADGATTWSELTSVDVSGVHKRSTSETYVVGVEMPSRVPAHSTFRMSMKLTSGGTFKLMGLTVCG